MKEDAFLTAKLEPFLMKLKQNAFQSVLKELNLTQILCIVKASVNLENNITLTFKTVSHCVVSLNSGKKTDAFLSVSKVKN